MLVAIQLLCRRLPKLVNSKVHVYNQEMPSYPTSYKLCYYKACYAGLDINMSVTLLVLSHTYKYIFSVLRFNKDHLQQ